MSTKDLNVLLRTPNHGIDDVKELKAARRRHKSITYSRVHREKRRSSTGGDTSLYHMTSSGSGGDVPVMRSMSSGLGEAASSYLVRMQAGQKMVEG